MHNVYIIHNSKIVKTITMGDNYTPKDVAEKIKFLYGKNAPFYTWVQRAELDLSGNE